MRRKYGKPYWSPRVQRFYKWRGPAHALGDDIIVMIYATDDLRAIQPLMGTNDWMSVLHNLDLYYQEVAERIRTKTGYPNAEDDGWAPKDTGKLRKSIHTSLTARAPNGLKILPSTVQELVMAINNDNPILRIGINTGKVLYANPVNNTPTINLRHDPSMGKEGRGGTLNDPGAITEWWNMIRKDARDFARRARTTLIHRLGGSGQDFKEIEGYFQFQFR